MRRLSRQPRHLQKASVRDRRRGRSSLAASVLAVTGAWLLVAWWAHARHATAPTPAHHAPQFKQMHDAMRAAAAEVQFEPPEPRPARQSDRSDPYGNYTKVLGLETCAAFRAANPIIASRRFAPAGLFNSATNALWQTVLSNCRVSRHGRNDLFHPPWGKHNPASWRGRHLANMFTNSSALGWQPRMASVLPVAVSYTHLTLPTKRIV